MATLESVQSNSVDSGDLVITKPVSLAEGDLMFAGVGFSNDNGAAGAITTPAGWTEIDREALPGAVGLELVTFSKTADITDVVATNFTFTSTGFGDYGLAGFIARISSPGSIVGSSSNNADGSSATITTTGFTPTKANTLFLGVLMHIHPTAQNNVSVALDTDNPTWTEEAEESVNLPNRDVSIALYSSSRTETTATGTITGTISAAVNGRALAVYSYSTQVNGSVSQETKVNAYAYNPVDLRTGVEAIVEDVTTASRDVTQWTNETKPIPTWTNESL